MTDNLYREIILDHYRDPQFKGELDDANFVASEVNPLCGDALTFLIRFNPDNIVEAVAWQGEGCAIAVASADMLSDTLIGLSIDQIKLITKESIVKMMGIEPGPTRLKCALLSISTIHKGLRQQGLFDLSSRLD